MQVDSLTANLDLPIEAVTSSNLPCSLILLYLVIILLRVYNNLWAGPWGETEALARLHCLIVSKARDDTRGHFFDKLYL